MEKRGGNEQHAARITVGVWTFISLCPLLVLGDLNFDRVSFCVARSWLFIGLYLGPQNALPQVFTVQGVLSSLLFSTKCFLRAVHFNFMKPKMML